MYSFPAFRFPTVYLHVNTFRQETVVHCIAAEALETNSLEHTSYTSSSRTPLKVKGNTFLTRLKPMIKPSGVCRVYNQEKHIIILPLKQEQECLREQKLSSWQNTPSALRQATAIHSALKAIEHGEICLMWTGASPTTFCCEQVKVQILQKKDKGSTLAILLWKFYNCCMNEHQLFLALSFWTLLAHHSKKEK